MKPETTHGLSSLQNEMPFLTSYFDFFVSSSTVQLCLKLDGKNEPLFQDLLLLQDGDFKKFRSFYPFV